MADELVEEMVAKTEELAEEKKGEEALAEASELVKIDPRDAIVWFVKGKAHYVDAQYDEALACFSKAAELEKENPQIWHMMGYCLITLGDYAKAEESLVYVKAMQPDNAEAICALGISQVLQGKSQDARKNIELSISANKPVALAMLEHFHEKVFALSKDTSSSAKAMIERTLQTARLVR